MGGTNIVVHLLGAILLASTRLALVLSLPRVLSLGAGVSAVGTLCFGGGLWLGDRLPKVAGRLIEVHPTVDILTIVITVIIVKRIGCIHVLIVGTFGCLACSSSFRVAASVRHDKGSFVIMASTTSDDPVSIK